MVRAKAKATPQVIWAATQFNEAYNQKAINFTFPDGTQRPAFWLRATHYHIVSKVIPDRQIPTRKRGTTRLYENTKKDYKRLSELLVKARLVGLVRDIDFYDNRNDFIIEPEARSRFGLDYITYDVDGTPYFDISNFSMKTFKHFTETISINPQFTPNKFSSQLYEIIVVTEKLTVREVIHDICMQYGANCLILKGQSSFTRVQDICRKAQLTNRPVLLLGIYDLDCAGWDMPVAFMRRVNEDFPNIHHRFERIALLRNQAIAENLPASFEPDDKGYPEKQKQRFYDETNGRECIELDALDPRIIRNLLEERLKYYSGVRLDEIREKRLKRKENKRLDEIVDNLEFNGVEEKYNKIYRRYKKFYKIAKRAKEILELKSEFLANRIRVIENKITDELKQEAEGDS